MKNTVAQTGGSEHRWSDEEATIRVPSVSTELRVLHLTDTHVSKSGPADEPFVEYSRRMNQAYAESRHHLTDEETTPEKCFRDALKFASESDIDLLVLTGDIINNPSATSVAEVRAALDGVGIDYLYIPGNHDWHYEGMEGTSDELRARWRAERLLPLYGNGWSANNTDCFSVPRGDVLFVAVDNSTYQFNDAQLECFNRSIETGLPMVLLIHIPLSIESMPNMLCGHPEWGADTDKNFSIERRSKWPETGNSATTREFVRAVAEAPNLVAVLTGHTHVPHVGSVAPTLFRGTAHPTALQYVTRAGAHGGRRLVRFLPAGGIDE
jgi:predicted MPP superfamily phosphohydrolase